MAGLQKSTRKKPNSATLGRERKKKARRELGGKKDKNGKTSHILQEGEKETASAMVGLGGKTIREGQPAPHHYKKGEGRKGALLPEERPC